MAPAPILRLLLLFAVTRCRGDVSNGYRNGKAASQFGELLKPPPPPPLAPLYPVPFHGGAGRTQRQNADIGYQYQPPPPPPPPPLPTSSNFKFPAPFYKQYNFNFVPPPQPFTTTPSPSLFQKVSGWLFSSQQNGYDTGSNNPEPVKKDCNPCNAMPWIPVIRYDLGAKNVHINSNPSYSPTYGPPSPTAYLDAQNIASFKPQSFRQQQSLPQVSTGVPHAVYGPPNQHQSFANIPSSTYGPPISTYGPPSPTHTILLPSQSPLSSTFSAPSSSYSAPSSSYGIPSSSFGHSSSPYSISSSTYVTTSPSPPNFSASPLTSTYEVVTPSYEQNLQNYQHQSDIEVLRSPDLDLQLPRVTPPTTFKNSYGETISNSYISDIPYSVSASAAESTKIKTEVLPNSSNPLVPNVSLALANPAPFTLNRGRNIHTLQPVALPNLSVSPLPPIFNARPFRPTSQYPQNLINGINSMQHSSNDVKIEHSVPVAEFTHSIEYPATIIQSPVIEVNAPKQFNQSKTYRNIPNAYVVNEIRDISSQASEDHVSSTKTLQDASFESTGVDVGNELYDSGIPPHFKNTKLPPNHKTEFADLRGVKDEDVDKYRTEINLQNIDSPLLYLKPSAPHKGYGDFVLAISTPSNENEYEIYDDIPTTESTQTSTHATAWDESRNDYNDGQPPPTAAQESVHKPKIVQIIVPYTSSKENNYNNFNYIKNLDDWAHAQEEEYQARKIPSNTEHPYINTASDNYDTSGSTTEDTTQPETEGYDSERLNPAAILNDLYDVKEPPFDIIKLQHTIDDWTEQEYSEQHKTAQKNRGSEKFAKQIPDDYFTTTTPSSYVTPIKNYEYDYDHEGSSSIILHTVTEKKNKVFKEYNSIERPKSRYNSGKGDEFREKQKLHIYTAASSFRGTTATPAPWGKILTSISPLTKEKIYVVTSKPWREARNVSEDWYEDEAFESKKTSSEDSETSSSDNLPFKSPRFINRPVLGFTSPDNNESMNSESSYGFSKSWYQSINDLENRGVGNNTTWPEGSTQKHTTNTDEDSTDTTTADLQSDKNKS